MQASTKAELMTYRFEIFGGVTGHRVSSEISGRASRTPLTYVTILQLGL
jgi:hypothetical protein